MVDEPPPATVPVAPLNVATDVSADVYVHVPATAELLSVAVGLVSVNGASPYVGAGSVSEPSVGVARLMVMVIGSLVCAS